jgi:hypothetical protein
MTEIERSTTEGRGLIARPTAAIYRAADPASNRLCASAWEGPAVPGAVDR